jgi:hypothetical protein
MRLLYFSGTLKAKNSANHVKRIGRLTIFNLIVLQTQPTALTTLISLTAALVSGDAATGDSGDGDYLGS